MCSKVEFFSILFSTFQVQKFIVFNHLIVFVFPDSILGVHGCCSIHSCLVLRRLKNFWLISECSLGFRTAL
jgi:hypothetical protein